MCVILGVCYSMRIYKMGRLSESGTYVVQVLRVMREMGGAVRRVCSNSDSEHTMRASVVCTTRKPLLACVACT